MLRFVDCTMNALERNKFPLLKYRLNDLKYMGDLISLSKDMYAICLDKIKTLVQVLKENAKSSRDDIRMFTDFTDPDSFTTQIAMLKCLVLQLHEYESIRKVHVFDSNNLEVFCANLITGLQTYFNAFMMKTTMESYKEPSCKLQDTILKMKYMHEAFQKLFGDKVLQMYPDACRFLETIFIKDTGDMALKAIKSSDIDRIIVSLDAIQYILKFGGLHFKFDENILSNLRKTLLKQLTDRGSLSLHSPLDFLSVQESVSSLQVFARFENSHNILRHVDGLLVKQEKEKVLNFLSTAFSIDGDNILRKLNFSNFPESAFIKVLKTYVQIVELVKSDQTTQYTISDFYDKFVGSISAFSANLRSAITTVLHDLRRDAVALESLDSVFKDFSQNLLRVEIFESALFIPLLSGTEPVFSSFCLDAKKLALQWDNEMSSLQFDVESYIKVADAKKCFIKLTALHLHCNDFVTPPNFLSTLLKKAEKYFYDMVSNTLDDVLHNGFATVDPVVWENMLSFVSGCSDCTDSITGYLQAVKGTIKNGIVESLFFRHEEIELCFARITNLLFPKNDRDSVKISNLTDAGIKVGETRIQADVNTIFCVVNELQQLHILEKKNKLISFQLTGTFDAYLPERLMNTWFTASTSHFHSLSNRITNHIAGLLPETANVNLRQLHMFFYACEKLHKLDPFMSEEIAKPFSIVKAAVEVAIKMFDTGLKEVFAFNLSKLDLPELGKNLEAFEKRGDKTSTHAIKITKVLDEKLLEISVNCKKPFDRAIFSTACSDLRKIKDIVCLEQFIPADYGRKVLENTEDYATKLVNTLIDSLNSITVTQFLKKHNFPKIEQLGRVVLDLQKEFLLLGFSELDANLVALVDETYCLMDQYFEKFASDYMSECLSVAILSPGSDVKSFNFQVESIYVLEQIQPLANKDSPTDVRGLGKFFSEGTSKDSRTVSTKQTDTLFVLKRSADFFSPIDSLVGKFVKTKLDDDHDKCVTMITDVRKLFNAITGGIALDTPQILSREETGSLSHAMGGFSLGSINFDHLSKIPIAPLEIIWEKAMNANPFFPRYGEKMEHVRNIFIDVLSNDIRQLQIFCDGDVLEKQLKYVETAVNALPLSWAGWITPLKLLITRIKENELSRQSKEAKEFEKLARSEELLQLANKCRNYMEKFSLKLAEESKLAADGLLRLSVREIMSTDFSFANISLKNIVGKANDWLYYSKVLTECQKLATYNHNMRHAQLFGDSSAFTQAVALLEEYTKELVNACSNIFSTLKINSKIASGGHARFVTDFRSLTKLSQLFDFGEAGKVLFDWISPNGLQNVKSVCEHICKFFTEIFTEFTNALQTRNIAKLKYSLFLSDDWKGLLSVFLDFFSFSASEQIKDGNPLKLLQEQICSLSSFNDIKKKFTDEVIVIRKNLLKSDSIPVKEQTHSKMEFFEHRELDLSIVDEMVSLQAYIYPRDTVTLDTFYAECVATMICDLENVKKAAIEIFSQFRGNVTQDKSTCALLEQQCDVFECCKEKISNKKIKNFLDAAQHDVDLKMSDILEKIKMDIKAITETEDGSHMPRTNLLVLCKTIGFSIPSYTMICNIAIDDMLNFFLKDKGAKAGSLLISSISLNLKQHPEETVALKMIDDHDAFKEFATQIFNQATNSFKIQLVLSRLEKNPANTCLNGPLLQQLYDKFHTHYWEQVMKVANTHTAAATVKKKYAQSLEDIAIEANLLKNKSIPTCQMVVSLMALLFAHWTLSESEKFFERLKGGGEKYDITQQLFLKQPHPAQIVSILRLLGIDQQEVKAETKGRTVLGNIFSSAPDTKRIPISQLLSHHLVEIKTGLTLSFNHP